MAWATALATLGGTLYSAQQAKSRAKDQMSFQRDMSNTAYQRAMADLQQAGINPIMVSKLGGASTPTGAMAPTPDFGSIPEKTAKALATAKQIQLFDAQVKNVNEQAKVHASQIQLNESNSAKNTAEMRLKDAQTNKIGIETSLSSLDLLALQKLGLSPMQMKYTVFNQAGSEFYDKAKEIAKDAGKTVEDVYDTVYDYVIREVREQKNWTIPFVVNNPHLIMEEMEAKLKQGERWFRNLVKKRGWK